MHARRRKVAAALAAALTLVAALATGAQARPDASESTASHTIKIGIVYPRTGAFAPYGAEYLSGLRLGLTYATGGTGKVTAGSETWPSPAPSRYARACAARWWSRREADLPIAGGLRAPGRRRV